MFDGLIHYFKTYAIFILIIAFLWAFISVYRTSRIGDKYENKVWKQLKKHLNIAALRNLILPNEILEETEADMVFVNTKGIFAIECKHRGSDQDIMRCDLYHDWSAPHGENLHNPFKQNEAHIYSLKRILRNKFDLHIYNIVIINNDFEFNYLGRTKSNNEYTDKDSVNLLESEGKMLIKSTNIGFKSAKKHIDKMPDVYTKEEVLQIYNILKLYEANKDKRKEFKKKKELEALNNHL